MKEYHFCSVTEVNGGVEYSSSFLMLRRENESIDELLMSVVLNYRGEGDGELEEDGLVWFSDCLAISEWSSRKITEEDANVLKKYLSVL